MGTAAEDRPIEDMIRDLRPAQRDEVRAFVEDLLARRQKRTTSYLKLPWAGGLQEFRGEYTSRQLQKKALDWWGK